MCSHYESLQIETLSKREKRGRDRGTRKRREEEREREREREREERTRQEPLEWSPSNKVYLALALFKLNRCYELFYLELKNGEGQNFLLLFKQFLNEPGTIPLTLS